MPNTNLIGDLPADLVFLTTCIENLPGDLTVGQRSTAIELTKRNSDMFSGHEFDSSLTDLRKGVRLQQMERRLEAFNKPKFMLCNAPVL